MKIFSQRKSINLLFISAILILFMVGIYGYQKIQILFNENILINNTDEQIKISHYLLSDLYQRQSMIDQYVLNGDKKLLESIVLLDENIKKNIQILKSLLLTDFKQQKQINNIETSLAQELNDRKKLFDLNKNKETSVAEQLIQYHHNQLYYEALQKLIFNLNNKEMNFANHFQSKFHNISLIILGNSSISMILFVLCFILLNYHFRLKNIAENNSREIEERLIISNKDLQESERRYQTSITNSNIGIWNWEVGTERVYYSPQFKQLLGYSDDEFPPLSITFEKILHPLDVDRLFNLVNQHLEEDVPFNIEYRLKTKSKGYRWYQATGKVSRDNTGRPVRMAGSIIDVHERKKVEENLNLQYNIMKLLSAPETLETILPKVLKLICETLHQDFAAIWVINKEVNLLQKISEWHRPNLNINFFLKKTNELKIQPNTGILGKVWNHAQAIWVPDLNEENDFLRKTAAMEAGFQTLYCVPILFQKQVLGLIELFSKEKINNKEELADPLLVLETQIGQFLERKKSEIALKKSEAHKTAILESAYDVIMTTDTGGNILSSNSKASRVFGYSPEELQNKNIGTLVQHFMKKMKNILNKPAVEFMGIHKNGTLFPIELTVASIEMDQPSFVVIIRNISERKKIDNLKNEFISIVSHELRTPLTSILGSLALLLSEKMGGVNYKQKQLLDIANKNSERLIKLINDILDIQKIELGKIDFKLDPVNINELIKESVNINQVFADKFGVSLQFNPLRKDLFVLGDADKIMQVMANLISNAIKYSEKGQSVTISASKTTNNTVRVEVIDKGPGIPTEFHSRIFEKFSQADSSVSRVKGGTGLGLSISRAIIEKLNGTIGFKSNPEGTNFYFELPMMKQKTVYSRSMDNDTFNILICGNTDVDFLKSVIEENQYEAVLSVSAQQAKIILQNKKIEAIILDLNLHDQDGISLIKELNQSDTTSHIPIIVISDEIEKRKIELGQGNYNVIDWINKPIEIKKLNQAISMLKSNIKKMPLNNLNVLYVEDDIDLVAHMLHLLPKSIQVTNVTTLNEARKELENKNFDLAILDLLLPDGSGLDLISIMSKKQMPVIVFSSYELPKHYANLVSAVLNKSTTTEDKLLEAIDSAIKSNVQS